MKGMLSLYWASLRRLQTSSWGKNSIFMILGIIKIFYEKIINKFINTENFNEETLLNDDILLNNFGGIGDEILFYPVIETLRYAYPHAFISILVEPRCHNLLDHHYFIDEVLTFDIKHRKSPGDLLDLLKRHPHL